MSAGDVVCTGWLIKSPPEKKLKRFAWRKRWFVLRRGRMSGNPDVLEYYQNNTSKKPIRTIDLKECEVEMLNGQLRIRHDFSEKHLFVVKTSARIFYLVAKTEEEMHSWISSISQICQFGSLDDAESSEDSFPHTPMSLQPSPDSSDRTSLSSHLDSSLPPDYLYLSQCKTGSVGSCSFSTSEISLEQKSEESVRDVTPSPLRSESCCIPQFSPGPSLFPHPRLANPPLSAPCTSMTLPAATSSPQHHCASNVFKFDKPYMLEATCETHTPPPLPPKPSHVSEKRTDGGCLTRPVTLCQFLNHTAPFSRRTSLSSLDHFKIAADRSMQHRRQSLNLPCLSTMADESYIPMASPSVTTAESDGYIPMRPIASFDDSSAALASPSIPAGDIAPPPIHRHLKPRLRRARPPPLDLRGLSTITECPTHLPLCRTLTDSLFLHLERRLENGDKQREGETSLDSRLHFPFSCDGTQARTRKTNLDYLSLDFNSASPSPVQKKPFLSDEYKVDYVVVDEKKTQALQNTKMEWTDVRQSQT
ncbi:GRB2-associated-binding protein 3 [Neosynchiropus ocellatus]